jgi:hypothetical protein
MQIAIIGTGRMARGIAFGLRETAHDVTFGARRLDQATALAAQMSDEARRRYRAAGVEAALARADLAFLAVPWPAALEVVTAARPDLDGRVVVDLTNPVAPSLDHLLVPADSSASELLAEAAGPRARVVAALKNTFAATFAEPTIGGGPAPDVFVAGDDAEAKREVAALVQAMGFPAIDAGPLTMARTLERLTLLLLHLDRAGHHHGQLGLLVAGRR